MHEKKGLPFFLKKLVKSLCAILISDRIFLFPFFSSNVIWVLVVLLSSQLRLRLAYGQQARSKTRAAAAASPLSSGQTLASIAEEAASERLTASEEENLVRTKYKHFTFPIDELLRNLNIFYAQDLLFPSGAGRSIPPYEEKALPHAWDRIEPR